MRHGIRVATWITVTVAMLLVVGCTSGGSSDGGAVSTRPDSTTSVRPSSSRPGTSATTTTPDATSTEAPTSTDAPSTSDAPTTSEGAHRPEDLGLTIAPEGSDAGYDRDLFEHWIDADGDGCDTRCEVLERQRRTDLPGLAGGGWLSIYDDYSTDDASELDIDHVVALAEAWRSGASGWDESRRRAFANDLEAGALLAVTAASNRSKSDKDPAEWQPPARGSWCAFVEAWTTTKRRWGLTADEAEARALTNMGRACP